MNLFEQNAKAELMARPAAVSLESAVRFIATADVDQLQSITLALGNRLFDLEKQYGGMKAANLHEAATLSADVALDLGYAINASDEEPPLCANCNGSGEGQHDGTRCMFCRGTGHESENNEIDELIAERRYEDIQEAKAEMKLRTD